MNRSGNEDDAEVGILDTNLHRSLANSIADGACQVGPPRPPCTNINEVTIGKNSCNGEISCRGLGSNGGSMTVGDCSCLGYESCGYAGSNNGSTGTVGSYSCIGHKACYFLGHGGFDVTVGHNSCNCDGCCENLPAGSVIGDCQCNGDPDMCAYEMFWYEYIYKPGTCDGEAIPDNIPDICIPAGEEPSSIPSSVPSSVPSTVPSSMPTSCVEGCAAALPEDSKAQKAFCTSSCEGARHPGRCKGKCTSSMANGKASATDICEVLCNEEGGRRLLRGEVPWGLDAGGEEWN